MIEITLTDDQAEALEKIEGAYKRGAHYLLTGYAGSGKTTLMQAFCDRMAKKNKSVVLTAPTNKAVAVLTRKIKQAEIEGVDCITIHKLLGLKAKPRGDKLMFVRDKNAQPVNADVVVIDECSMIELELFRNIKRHIPMAFILFLGDPAQLPPVNEVESESFKIKNTTHLTTIVRQAAGNPILEAAATIRANQTKIGNADWGWCAQAGLDNKQGVYVPGARYKAWMRKAFTSKDFDDDPDRFRYLAWRNKRVHEINEMIRTWRYGENIPTPFVVGEKAMFRSPLVINKTVIFSTNEEATVLSIDEDSIEHEFPRADIHDAWTAYLPVWRIKMLSDSKAEILVNMPRHDSDMRDIVARVKDEAAESSYRWKNLHDFQATLANLQSIYAMTVHTSQGSTFERVFVDVPDIRRRQAANYVECQQMLYVAVTRASHAVILVGIDP